MADVPILQFDTLLTGRPVKIDGTTYHVKHPDRLTLSEMKRYEALAPRTSALLQQTKWTKAQQAELSDLLDQVCALILDAPPTVRARLSEAHRIVILGVFTQLRSPVRAAIGAMLSRTTRPPKTGAKRSRGSRASTGARRKTGSNGRPSA